MINYDDIWIPLQAGLENYVGKPVIQAETNGKQPPYPFISIKDTSTFNVGQPAITNNVETQTIKQDIEMVLSLTVHAKTIEESKDLCMKAQGYFLGKGAIELSDAGIAIVDVLPATNRDVFLTIDYERRYGFDVRLRIQGQETYGIDVIETVTIQEG